MDPITLLVAAAAVAWLYRRLTPSRPRRRTRPPAGARNRGGAGASAAARAHQLRSGIRPQLAALLGITTTAHRAAARYEAGAAGESATARLLAPLRHLGWTVLHDRRLPTGRANLDHLLISPRGRVVVCDSKLWSARQPLVVRSGRLMHGQIDVTARLDGLWHECATVAAVLGHRVTPVVAVHGPQLVSPDGMPVVELAVGDIRIVPAQRLREVLRRLDRATRQTPEARPLADRARRAFPPYGSR